MNKHLIIVPRWGGTAQHDWYPWITGELAQQSCYQSIHVCDMPNPAAPTIADWTQYLLMLLEHYELGQVVLAGHSVGCQAVLHALQQLNAGAKINTAVFIAGWWTVDKPWDAIIPWIDAKHDFDKIKAALMRSVVLLSDNDPFTADYQANAQLWRQRLGAEVRVITQARHFNAQQEMPVLQLLAQVSLL